MRDVGPVTGKEYALPADCHSLVSVTDLKGRITYCNQAFVTVSGFTMAELLGQPHNLVRHPDMPPEAFRDLWDTVSQGQPWTGLVKNRRKNGDHYWVSANVTPMRNGERITGFLSVRTVPERRQISAAEALYARLTQEAATGRRTTVLQAGRAVRQTAWSRVLPSMARVRALRLVWFQIGGAAVALVSALCLPLWQALLLTGLTLAFTCWQTMARVLRPLRQLLVDSQRLGAGDLAHQVTINTNGLTGSLQRALRQLQLNTRAIVSDARADVEGIRTIAQEIADGNTDLSVRTESQAGSLQVTSASVEQITGNVSQSASSAQRGERLASETSAVAQRSNEAVQATAQCMSEIDESSRRIGEIIQVVEGVAFQTNILALNAAVEAARAGEAGRGFAVVASEVRSLAQRTSEAAREIKRLIQESAERVARGSAKVDEATARVAEALGSVGQVSAVLAEISRSSGEQQAGLSQINEAMHQLDEITQRNTAMVEELAASAQALRSRVDTVSVSTRLLRLRAEEKTVSEMDAVELRRLHRAGEPSTPSRAD